MTENRIKILSRNDITMMAHLHHLCFEVSWQEQEIYAILNNRVNQAFGIFDMDMIIGFIITAFIPPEAEILTFCIHPNFQHKGFGSKILNFLKDYCHNCNIDRILIDVNVGNKIACSFYKKHKFNLVNIRKDYYKNGKGCFEDAHNLQLYL